MNELDNALNTDPAENMRYNIFGVVSIIASFGALIGWLLLLSVGPIWLLIMSTLGVVFGIISVRKEKNASRIFGWIGLLISGILFLWFAYLFFVLVTFKFEF